ncbi:DNA polymerase I [Anoxynatronum sibiricum]|uniref:DNA polymerase I n=1 Tax=Anoxynatronum sibiricum TaxID=210623 RepID=A0ABU9VRD3_9CLOT
MPEQIQRKLLIIDGNSLLNRAFYALPPLTNRDGEHTNAIYGFLTMLFKAVEEVKPDHAAVAFDLKAPTFRHDTYTEYKAGRKKMPMELAEQIEPLKEILDAMGLYRIQMEGFEADDLIGTLARMAESDGMTVAIVSGDRDVLQLVTEQTQVMITKKGITQMDVYDPDRFTEEYGIPVERFIDLKGLMGDSSDNIPGIPGVGPKTATKLLQEFGTIENLLEQSEAISNKKLKEKVDGHRQEAVLSKKLATIITNIPIELKMDDLRLGELSNPEVAALFRRLEFNSLLERISAPADFKSEKTADKHLWPEMTTIEALQELDGQVQQHQEITWYTLTDTNAEGWPSPVAAAFTIDGNTGWWLDCRNGSYVALARAWIIKWLGDPSILKKVHDLKLEKRAWGTVQIPFNGAPFDVMIADYLINPSKAAYDLEALSLHYDGQKVVTSKELWGTGLKRKKQTELDMEAMVAYLVQRTALIHRLTPELKRQLQELEMLSLYESVEMPLAFVLAEMESEGIELDAALLKDFEITYAKRIDDLIKQVHEVAGTEFNLNSTKQLGEVLFVRLNLPPVKKTKTGYSTDVAVLEKLKNEHAIIPLILEYRQMTKIKSTYIDGLLAIVNAGTGRIHSTFHQTVAATGRISSADPNLQNIPVRTEMGRQLRRVFVAREGWQLIDADYSQIELRIMAHLSGDPGFIKAFKEEADIHTRTAAEIFQVSEESVTGEMRSSAKAVNFGIIYGISDFGLSNNLNISRQQARLYIDDYLHRYASVKTYMDEMVTRARDKGYVTTLLHRIRYIPEINSKNFNLRSFGERMAMNTPIQGSAADIIKVAMVRVADELKKGNYQARLILQVHDELIVEAPPEEVEPVSLLLRQAMEEAAELSVPLKVDLSVATNWFDAK